MYKKLTHDQIASIVAQRSAGVKLEALAAEFSVSTSTIFYHTSGHPRGGQEAQDRHRERIESAADTRAKVCASYERGATVVALAKRHSVSTVTIRTWLARGGVKLRGSVKITVTDDQIATLYRDERRPIRAVATALGISATTVCRRLKEMKIPAHYNRTK